MPLMFDTGNVAERIDWGKEFLKNAISNDTRKLHAISPAHQADKIKTGVFLIHGSRDLQAHYEHANLMRDALIKSGNPPKWLWKQNEGHGFYDEDNISEMYREMLAFLSNYLDD